MQNVSTLLGVFYFCCPAHGDMAAIRNDQGSQTMLLLLLLLLVVSAWLKGFIMTQTQGYGARTRGSEPVSLPRTKWYSGIVPAKFLHDLPEARIGSKVGE